MASNMSLCNDMHRSADFNDFVAKCLVKDPAQRSAAADLLQVSAECYAAYLFCNL